MRLLIGSLIVLAFAAPAHAENLARGMELRAPDHARSVELVRGTVHVTLFGGGRDLIIGVQLDVDRKHERVTLVFDGNCGGGDTQHYTYDELEAMLEAEAARKLLAAKDAHGAALGYAKAVSLDPKHLGDQEQLALALMRDGRRRTEAATALRTAMRDRPLEVLAWIERTPDVAPLASEPELAALTAGPPGTFARASIVGYEPVHGWVGVVQSSGSSMAEHVGGSALEILGPTGTSIVHADDALVTKLGFDPALDGAVGHQRDDDPSTPATTSAHVAWTAKPRDAGISVLCSDKGVLRVFARQQMLAEDEHASCNAGLASSHAVYVVPHAIVSTYTISIGDGCGGEWFTEFHVTPLTRTGPPAMEALEAAATADRAARAGRLDEAAAAYARAIALAPDRLDFTRRQVVVLARNHRTPEALAALARLTPADRLFTIHTSPELAALASAPEVLALHGAKPGTARDFTGYQAASHLVAFRVDRDDNSGKSSGVQLVDARTGKLVTELPLALAVESDHCDVVIKDSCIKKALRPVVHAREAAVHQVLTDMGFDAPIESLTAKAQPTGNAAAWRATSRAKQFEIACSAKGDLSVTRAGKDVLVHPTECDTSASQILTHFADLVLAPGSRSDPQTGATTAVQEIVPIR